jgi:hypothetical protein
MSRKRHHRQRAAALILPDEQAEERTRKTSRVLSILDEIAAGLSPSDEPPPKMEGNRRK